MYVNGQVINHKCLTIEVQNDDFIIINKKAYLSLYTIQTTGWKTG